MTKVTQSVIDVEALLDGVSLVLEGRVKKLEVAPGIKVYECKDVIRIDLKTVEKGGN